MKEMILIVLFLLSSALLSPTVEASDLQGLPESCYVEQWCTRQGGVIEHVLPDHTRCCCLTSNYAIEFDFGERWYEAVGQSMHYGFQTNHKPGIVLNLKSQSDMKYWLRLNKNPYVPSPSNRTEIASWTS